MVTFACSNSLFEGGGKKAQADASSQTGHELSRSAWLYTLSL